MTEWNQPDITSVSELFRFLTAPQNGTGQWADIHSSLFEDKGSDKGFEGI